MRHVVTGLAAALIASLLASPLAAPASAQGADPLAALKGEKRIVLLFSKSRSLAALDRQEAEFRERRPDVRERDMVVFTVPGSDPVQDAIGYERLPYGATRALRRRYAPEGTGLTVVLIGKDGGEKARWERAVDPDEVFALIDAMPMRQREMREGS